MFEFCPESKGGSRSDAGGKNPGWILKILLQRLPENTTVVQGSVMVSQSLENPQGVSVMYNWTNWTNAQGQLHNNVRRGFMWRGQKTKGWGEKLFLVNNFLLLGFCLVDLIQLAPLEWLGGGWGVGGEVRLNKTSFSFPQLLLIVRKRK